MWTLEVDLAGPVHQAARHEGGAVIQVPVLPDGVDTGLEKKNYVQSMQYFLTYLAKRFCFIFVIIRNNRAGFYWAISESFCSNQSQFF